MRWVAALYLLVAAACSLVTPLDELRGDAGSDVDASTQDATSSDSDAGPLGFCASLSPAPTFCADFDEDAAVGVGFTAMAVANGALAIDTSTAVSSPASLRATIDSFDASAIGAAGLNEILPGAPTHIHASFDLRVEQIDPTGEVELMTFEVVAGGTTRDLFFERAGNNAYLTEESIAADGGFHSSNIPINGIGGVSSAWVNVRLDVDLSTAMATVTIGTSVTTKPLTDFIAPGATVVNVGITYVNTPTAGWVLSFDNVTVDVSN